MYTYLYRTTEWLNIEHGLFANLERDIQYLNSVLFHSAISVLNLCKYNPNDIISLVGVNATLQRNKTLNIFYRQQNISIMQTGTTSCFIPSNGTHTYVTSSHDSQSV